ncbi:MAG: hypothetical protein A3B30_02505 [Candidatus Komeilibacteria bacterium RIFCSPLOWO2_01_FULL_52_15]|uniref:Uncharacterized protein n=1 Tax=Candidatus Komeilibacteria bacterium RIFCSPLOWO2_01_FULL_52_15 TaxID=1798551 RepID=A0A1G2BQH6_9BACT|nr:MAG: hypothetical protein A3B30_02505 [Candidatus Komeilibacteria bacterium RIFCSPLOWO2_01_FULL_52_15]
MTTPTVKRTALFTYTYLICFVVFGLWQQNYEFIFYSFIILSFLIATLLVYRHVELSSWIIVSLSFFGLLHLAAGNVRINGIRLYELAINGGRYHFDNIVHFFGGLLVTLILFNLLYPFIDERVQRRYIIFYGLVILMALGVGSINELVEFIAYLTFGVLVRVGDYYNNSLDIVFNTLGSIVGVVIIHLFSRRRVTLIE